MIITYHMLTQANACQSQVELFLDLFPSEEVELTEELCVEHRHDFDWNWAAHKLLSEEQSDEYYRQDSIRAATYTNQQWILCKKYNKQEDPLQEWYHKQRDLNWNNYKLGCAKSFYKIASGTQDN